jgi:single-stranded DNA-binding protein
MFNTTLIGRIGNDPETRQAGDSTVTEIQVAYENRRASDPETEWVKVECWNGLGTDVVAKYARKGDRIAITANRFRTEAYITRDGDPVSKLVLTAVDVELLGDRRNDAQPEF